MTTAKRSREKLHLFVRHGCEGSAGGLREGLAGCHIVRYAWLKPGVVAAAPDVAMADAALAFTPPGMPEFAFHSTSAATASPSSSSTVGLTVGLGNGPVGFSTTVSDTSIVVLSLARCGGSLAQLGWNVFADPSGAAHPKAQQRAVNIATTDTCSGD
jgi:hypothetical protein